MQYRELKDFARAAMISEAVNSFHKLPKAVIDGIPERMLDRWDRQWRSTEAIEEVPDNPRLVNHFTIGADPEFSLVDHLKGSFINAENLGLVTGAAFGMDMNGRLAELRPIPSRFALDVLASVWSELRWMALSIPTSRELSWQAVPYDGRDGLGGHIHFARKQADEVRRHDVDALDGMFETFRRGNIYNDVMCANRIKQTKYGHYGDIRFQKHGYEYRSLPTWLSSPWLAYLTLVVAKLLVYNRQHSRSMFMAVRNNPSTARVVVENLLSYYKGLDDDALIAYLALKRHGLPTMSVGDFKPNWGILFPANANSKDISWYPSMIEPSMTDKQGMLNWLIRGEMLRPEKPEVTWDGSKFPKGYTSSLVYSPTRARLGIGEIGTNIICHERYPLHLGIIDQEDTIRIMCKQAEWPNVSKALKPLTAIKTNRSKYSLYCKYTDHTGVFVDLPPSLRANDTVGPVKRILTSCGLPFWNPIEVKEGLIEAWFTGQKVAEVKATVAVKYKGRVIEEGQ